MLGTHSLMPFKRVLAMSDGEYDRIVKGAQDELAERGESAKIYIKVSVLLKFSRVSSADCCTGILRGDKDRRGHQVHGSRVLQSVLDVEGEWHNNTLAHRRPGSAPQD